MRLESVGKRYGLRQPWVVRSVSLDVLPGRLIRLEGRNGSGKSTLLRVGRGGVAAVALLAVTWTASALAAARRERSLA
jgi:ABC-type multidrug transport system ATPase subunit